MTSINVTCLDMSKEVLFHDDTKISKTHTHTHRRRGKRRKLPVKQRWEEATKHTDKETRERQESV